MSIPKVIHYCWFGRNPKPKLAEKCIKSWKKYCSDYEIIEWNEDNYDLSKAPLYVQQAYEAKKWAFVTDYVRLQVVYENGGIYMDTDVELVKNLDLLLEYNAYFGFEDGKMINTGLGFGAIQGFNILKEMMDDYWGIPFVMAYGSFDTMPCPFRNTQVLLKYGLKQDDSRQVIEEKILILPKEIMCPIDYASNRRDFTEKMISIHWYSASWYSKEERKERKDYLRRRRIENLCHTGRRILGDHMYESLRDAVKKVIT